MRISPSLIHWLEYNIEDFSIYDGKLMLYHGSPDEIRIPMISKSKVNGERGRGFYLFFNQKAATLNKYIWDGYVNVYELDLDKLNKVSSAMGFVEAGHIIKFVDNLCLHAGGNAIGYRVLTLDTGTSGYTKYAGGQLVVHRQDAIDKCLEFKYSTLQRELRDFYIEQAKGKVDLDGLDGQFYSRCTSDYMSKKPGEIIEDFKFLT